MQLGKRQRQDPTPIAPGINVVRPVVNVPSNKPAPKKRNTQSFHQILERLMGPMGFVFALSMAAKSSYFWTLHILDYSKLPPPFPDIINATSGLSIAFSLEIIGVAAGGKAYRLLMERYNVALKTSLKGEAKKATERQLMIQVCINLFFALFGIVGSSAALIAFAGAHGVAGGADNLQTEVLTAVALQFAALYIGVFYEPTRADATKELSNQVYDSMGTAYQSFGEKLAAGTATNAEIRAMQKMLSPTDRNLLDSLIKGEGGAELWDSTKVAYFLMELAHWTREKQDEMFATVQHNVTNRMRKNQDNAEFAINPKIKGRGLEIPADKMFLLFLPEVESAKTNGIIFASNRKAKPNKAASNQDRNGTGAEKDRNNDGTKNAASVDEVVAATV